MGFYGNITNTSRTSFQFDKTYPNKVALENAATTDEVFIGRFVLVEYGEGQDYNENYQIDIDKYGVSRGYDSTVWQKVFLDGEEKYVMIAELNTVVPTFDLAVNAPTSSPQVPKFNTDSSSNIYYKLHIQPSWGLRVKSANPNLYAYPQDINGENLPSGTGSYLDLSLNSNPFKSDQKTKWNKTFFNGSKVTNLNYYINGEVTNNNSQYYGNWTSDKEAKEIPAAIYYNKAGFSPDTISYDKDTTDEINITATGLSGNLYCSNSATNQLEPQVDTQELSIMLPSIGNAISQMWDIVYGDENINGSTTRNMVIDWLDDNTGKVSTGLRLLTRNEDGYTYNPTVVNTLAGAINSVHDLMGMIIVNDSESDEDINASSLDENKIYYLSGTTKKFYYIHTTYEYTPSNDPKVERYIMDSENKEYPIGMKWTSDNIPEGVELGTRSEKKELKELEGFAHNYNTIHGLILRINQMLDQGNELTRDTSTVQGIINSLNDILFSFGELAPGQIAVTNQYGQLTTAELRGDDWIAASYSGDGQINIKHKGEELNFSQSFNTQGKNATLAFGDSFTSPQINIETDEKGHTTNLNISPINLTLPKFTNSVVGSGNVVSGININGLDSISPSIAITKNNVGNLSLNTYNIATASEGIKSEDSISTALGKLEYKIGKSEVSSQISDAINKLDVEATGQEGHYINSIKEVDGKIEATTKEFTQDVVENGIYAVTSGAVYKYLQDTFTGTNKISSVGTIKSGTWNSSLGQDIVKANNIQDGVVGTEKITDGAITDTKIKNVNINKVEGNLPINRLAGGTQENPLYLNTNLIQTNSITPDKISTNIVNTVTENEVTSYSLNSNFIKNSSISISKLQPLNNYSSTQVEVSAIIDTDTLITALKKLEESIKSLKESNTTLTNKITALEERLAELETPETTT